MKKIPTQKLLRAGKIALAGIGLIAAAFEMRSVLTEGSTDTPIDDTTDPATEA